MNACRSCRRHLIHAEPTCPFCGADQPSGVARTLKRVGTGVMSVLTPMVLAACYGAPMNQMKVDDTGAVDGDSDGYTTVDDCDDTNADIHPDATELCDDLVDNNCDGKADSEDPTCTGG